MEYFIAILIGALMISMAARTRPLFPMKCHYCGRRNRNWEIVPRGHDDFEWSHRCGATR